MRAAVYRCDRRPHVRHPTEPGGTARTEGCPNPAFGRRSTAMRWTLGLTLLVWTGCGSATPPVVSPVARVHAAPPSDGRYTMRVRVTHYFAGESHSDPDTDAGRSSTGVPLRTATAARAGVCAVDPATIPYGSRVVVDTVDGLRSYLAADTGGAVRHRTASGGTVPVVDLYSPTPVGGDYQTVTVVPYRGSVPFGRLSITDKLARLDQRWTRRGVHPPLDQQQRHGPPQATSHHHSSIRPLARGGRRKAAVGRRGHVAGRGLRTGTRLLSAGSLQVDGHLLKPRHRRVGP